MNIENLVLFFGWMSVINVSILFVSAIALALGKEKFASIHSSLFKLDKYDVKKQYFIYLAFYKILIIVFNIVPYIALKLI